MGTTYDFWHLRSNGDFYLLEELYEDSQFIPNIIPGKAIFFSTRIVRVTEALLFATRLYKNLGVDDTAILRFAIRHNGLNERLLISHPNSAAHPLMTQEGPAGEQETTPTEITANINEIRSSTAKYVKTLLSPMFSLFSFFELPDITYEKIVAEFIAGEIR
jgi:hypothetical protein